MGDAHFFGLPGNPVAVMVAFYEFVQPSIRRMQGCSQLTAPRFAARCESKLRKSPGRIEYQRGIFATGADGHTTVRSTGKQGAGPGDFGPKGNPLMMQGQRYQTKP